MSLYSLIRPLLFRLDAEKAHHLTLKTLSYLPQCVFAKPLTNAHDALGLTFSHRVGLAAGLDKNAEYLDALSRLGFAFIEVGTITPKPQFGNPKPRLFRIPKAHAIINRMGFNNHGVNVLVANIQRSSYKGILGINIGKNKSTPLSQAVDDYLFCLNKVYQYASYISINLSSPNTPDLRQLQSAEYFEPLIRRLNEQRHRLADIHQKKVPLVIKVSPDEQDDALKMMGDTIARNGIEGIIATNTTCDHQVVQSFEHGTEEGGVSGQPLRLRSTECLRLLKSVVGEDVTLIGVGGIDSVKAAQEKINAGADLIQIYSGLIYQGPSLVKHLSSL